MNDHKHLDPESRLQLLFGPMRIVLNGHEVALRRLSLADKFDIAAQIRAHRQKAFIDQIESIPLPPEVISDALARIACSQVTTIDMRVSPEGQYYSVLRSMQKGDPRVSESAVKAMPPIDTDTMVRMVLYAHSADVEETEPRPTLSTTGSPTDTP